MTPIEAACRYWNRPNRAADLFPPADALLAMPAESLPLVLVRAERRIGDAEGYTAPLAAAVAALSGWLPDCRTDAELDEAFEHGQALLSCGVCDLDDLLEAVRELVEEMRREAGRRRRN